MCDADPAGRVLRRHVHVVPPSSQPKERLKDPPCPPPYDSPWNVVRRWNRRSTGGGQEIAPRLEVRRIEEDGERRRRCDEGRGVGPRYIQGVGGHDEALPTPTWLSIRHEVTSRQVDELCPNLEATAVIGARTHLPEELPHYATPFEPRRARLLEHGHLLRRS